MPRLCVVLVVTCISMMAGSCSSTKETSTAGSAVKESMLLGWVTRDVIRQFHGDGYFDAYAGSEIAPPFIELIGQVHANVEVLVFFGSWCSDTRRELPRFLKIADLSDIPPERIRFYGLDRSKASSDGLTLKHGIRLVPTFIFVRDGEEIGRIEEAPGTSLEADILSILAQPER